MGLWLSRPRVVDYDTLLASYQERIEQRQAKLQQIRNRERRANALFITYGVGIWLLYVVLWYFNVVSRYGDDVLAQIGRAAPVGAGPVVVIFARRFMHWWYRRKEAAEEAKLKYLVKKKQDKVEEIKKKTGYNTTRDLIEKYDEANKRGPPGSNAPTPVKLPASKPGVGKNAIPFPSAAGTPARPASAQGFMTPPNLNTPQQKRGPLPPQAFPPPGVQGAPFPPQPPATPQPRTFMDKVADALLGVAPDEGSPSSKYALICARCFAHNGLVPPQDFDFIQYQCPRCGYLNPRRRTPPASSLSAGDGPSHERRRVQSEAFPSPLSYGSSMSAPAGAEPGKLERIELERGQAEEGEREETVMSEEGDGEGRGTRKGRSTTALKEGTVAAKRKGRKTVESDEENDRMDED